MLNQQTSMRIFESEEPVLIGFITIPNQPEMETALDLYTVRKIENEGLNLLSEVYKVVKDKIRVAAVDINSEMGRRYAIILGID